MSIIQVTSRRRTGWLVTAGVQSQLFEPTETRIMQRHYGTALSASDARALLAAPEEYAPKQDSTVDHGNVVAGFGGLLAVEPLLRATSYADGSHALHLAVIDPGRVEGDELVITLADPAGLVVEAHWRTYAGSDVIDRFTVLRNGGDGDVDLLRAGSGAVALPDWTGYRRTVPWGRWGREGGLDRAPLTHGRNVSRGWEGLRSFMPPWVMIDDGSATEDTGCVCTAVLAWGGSGYVSAELSTNDRARVTAGIDDTDFRIRLRPGEEFTTPTLDTTWTDGGFNAASQAWHAHIRRHVLPRHADRPVLYNSWEATLFDVSEAGQRELARLAARAGAELLVMDDGWFDTRSDDHAGLGDWSVSPVKFPAGLAPLIREVRHLGMRFGIWVEPEMVNPDSDLYRQHPDWVVHTSGRPRSEKRNQLVLNFARPDVRQWAIGWLDALLRDNDITFVKWDCNRGLSEVGWPGESNPERVWVEHVRGTIAVLSEVRRRHPDTEFEICASGGARVSLDFLAVGEQAWTSDNTGAVERLSIQNGFSYIYPAVAMGAWVTDTGTTGHFRDEPLGYRFCVAMQGAMGIGGDLTRCSETDISVAAEWVALYKQIRPIIHQGRRFRVESTPVGVADVVAYVAENQSRAVVFAVGRGDWIDSTVARVRARGLDPDAEYDVRVISRDEDQRPTEEARLQTTGRVALTHGVSVGWPGFYPASVLVFDRTG